MVKATKYLECSPASSPTLHFIHYYKKIKYHFFICMTINCMNIFTKNWQQGVFKKACFSSQWPFDEKGRVFSSHLYVAPSIRPQSLRAYLPAVSVTRQKMTQPFRANRVTTTWCQQHPTAVCPPTIQYQDINYWKFLSIQTVAQENFFIRPIYAKRTCDHKLPLTRLLLCHSYRNWHHVWPNTHRPSR